MVVIPSKYCSYIVSNIPFKTVSNVTLSVSSFIVALPDVALILTLALGGSSYIS